MPQQHRRRQRRPVQQPWASGTSAIVLLALLLGRCQGFAFSSKAHHTRLDSPAAHNSNHRRDVAAPVLQRSRRRRRHPASPTIAGAHRDSGDYGRFSDTGDEPAYRPATAAGGASRSGRDWEEIGNADVLVPRDVDYPLGVVHFVGGQGVGVFPRNAYGALLEGLVDAGFLVVATRVRLNEFNHDQLACDVARDFRVAYRDVEALYGRTAMRRIPLFGVGHSLGAKVHVLLNCYPEVVDVARRRKANVIISFNNFPAKDSVPFINELRELGLSMENFGPLGDNLSGIAKAVSGLPLVNGFASQGLSLAEEWGPKAASAVGSMLSDVPQEFKPSPEATWDLLTDRYSVRNNLVLQFKRDTIDQSPQLAEVLFNRFGRDGELEFSRLDGTHVTPNTPDFRDTRQARDWADRAGMGAQGDAFVEGGARVAASTASLELDELIKALTSYLRSQSLWVRREGRWDSDEM
ncbi:conserved unknown protein [Ectocarpus siliculosus]|uniref:DUF1350 domain-containing protein n=1 Tax=Ectocarpus siliculosus TaxID=2880 RepID=D7FVS7_ECTSI|nr:conserved unknown protein [Ectocarpus siliculosus]|eukprot:CBJ25447.1 conserved unknown protein [Ectocarpus siliculosus]